MKLERVVLAGGLLACGLFFVGCGPDTSVSLPENPTAEAPSLEAASPGASGKSKGAGQSNSVVAP